eukprot:5603913-Amphidinium_carterae.1
MQVQTAQEDGQEYGQVQRMLGNGRCDLFRWDKTLVSHSWEDAQEGLGEPRRHRARVLARLPGTSPIIVRITEPYTFENDDLDLSWTCCEDEKGDIIVKYTAEEARNLKNYGELPDGTLSMFSIGIKLRFVPGL